MSYNHNEIESRWQNSWQEAQAFKAETNLSEKNSSKPKFYALDMFPYPSGAGLHIGHIASYTPTDVISRYKRAQGFNVLHPMGYDAFGLPAEQYAIQTGVHPAQTTNLAIDNFRRQLKSFGFSFDWSREISTCDAKYYRWTQYIFTKLFEKGLAYQKEVPVNWCPALKTVLANEEVIDGKSERGDHPVVRMPMKQWMLKITDYADRLLKDLDKIDWPERTKESQRNWIGKSEGAQIQFGIDGNNSSDIFEVFTTRPDTLFGVTFMVLAPEHPLVSAITTPDRKAAVDAYIIQSSRKLEVDRKAATVKSGEFTGAYALHPLGLEKIPIWIADYVLMDYGTGAIMAVPGHDQRDFEFATQFKIPIARVLESTEPLPFLGDGKLVNSESSLLSLNGLDKNTAIAKVISFIETKKIGQRLTQYKLRDWLFSRQRYWGEPFPIVHFSKSGTRALAADELPVMLPEVANYEPSDKGEPPLARVPSFVEYTDPKTGEVGRRDTDTMPGSAASSWYFLRFCDPNNDVAPFGFAEQKYWMPVDLYVGGPEHSVGHLLYARFWQKVLFDAGIVTHDEPFQKLAHQGTILAPDGFRMSKSRGNVVSLDTVKERYGCDAVRTFILFLGPLERDKPWQENGIDGVQRFLDRVWRICIDESGASQVDASAPAPALVSLLHKTIKKVGEDIEGLGFNTAISTMMILLNEVYKTGDRPKAVLKPLLQLLAPFAPHLCEEIWSKIGETGFISLAPWPKFDSTLTVDSQVTMGVQVNGKSRGTIDIERDASEATAVQAAMKIEAVVNALGGKAATKVIYKAGRILNLIGQV
jgi:leucyl-tRNA synthetase